MIDYDIELHYDGSAASPVHPPYIQAGYKCITASHTMVGTTGTVTGWTDLNGTTIDVPASEFSNRAASEQVGWFVLGPNIRFSLDPTVVGAGGVDVTVEFLLHPDGSIQTGTAALLNAQAATAGTLLLSKENVEHTLFARVTLSGGTNDDVHTFVGLAK